MAGQEKQWELAGAVPCQGAGGIAMDPMVLILYRTRSLEEWERHLGDLAHIYLYIYTEYRYLDML